VGVAGASVMSSCKSPIDTVRLQVAQGSLQGQ